MGIDALMFVRYVGDPPTQEQLDNWNKDLDYKIGIRTQTTPCNPGITIMPRTPQINNNVRATDKPIPGEYI